MIIRYKIDRSLLRVRFQPIIVEYVKVSITIISITRSRVALQCKSNVYKMIRKSRERPTCIMFPSNWDDEISTGAPEIALSHTRAISSLTYVSTITHSPAPFRLEVRTVCR